MTVPRIFYTPDYDISFWGIERLHPFDSRKSSRALQRIRSALGSELPTLLSAPSAPATEDSLRLVHEDAYLRSLRHSGVVAKALEVWPLRLLPARALDRKVLRPMRWAVQGTIEAARHALAHGAAINLAGGYHHSHRDHGEGFCVYADIPIAIEVLRAQGLLSAEARIAIIDLDAHRGNGFEAIYENDERVTYFDMYNFQVYPGLLRSKDERRKFVLSLRALMDDEGYFNVLKHHLPEFLGTGPLALAFYNAGTDVLAGDPLGRFSLTREAVLERDRYVIQSLEKRGIPWVMVPSGGYTEESHKLVADTVVWACTRERARAA
jgi:histone deacetylase 11